ncbi:MAG TPA: DUF4097 family beta strand repeat-containing protein [Gemmatimonadaceae bacterium]|nr:DUF4097 family beta strand repeat-containing protein [Gemmatimonadaceae bacterium]
MKMKGLAIAASLAVAVSLNAQTKVERGISLNSDGAVRVHALTGSVRIVGWARDSVSIRGTIGKGNTFHAGGGKMGMKMFVESEDQRSSTPSDLVINVPARAKVWVKTATADIDVSGVSGSLDLYVVGGKIRITGSPADVNAEAIDGEIRINGSPAWVRAKSASGLVSLRGNSGDVTLSTVSGAINFEGKTERGKFETVSGNISYAGTFERGGVVNFDTHSGEIELSVPHLISADFDIVSIAGPITNRLNSSKPIKGRYGKGSELSMSNSDGGTRIAIRSFKGPVTLVRSK